MADDKIRVPIKVVTPSQSDYYRPDNNFGPRKVFAEVDEGLRATLDSQLEEVGDHFSDAFRKNPKVPAVARVVLKSEAIAKSHRPNNILDRNTCPIIGGGDFGELFVSVRPAGLRSLRAKVKQTTTQTGVANLSVIERFEPFGSGDALRGQSPEELAVVARKTGRPLKVRLFSHRDAGADEALRVAFKGTARELGLNDKELAYSSTLTVHALEGAMSTEAVRGLGEFVGTQSLGTFPIFSPVRSMAMALRGLDEAAFPLPQQGIDYPVVGLIDTGIDPNNKLLNAWVVAREDCVPVAYRNYDHGTFVAGLLVHARHLNGGNARFPLAPVKIVDVIAVPDGGDLTELHIIAILQEVLPKYPEVRVWNMSLASETPCTDGSFSDFAAAIDELQDRHECTIVVPTGNYRGSPRGWPPPALGETDRMCPPADAVRSLTVASVAHLATPAARVRVQEPSPFSRRGPGPAFLPKPELAHYGGNLDRNGGHQQLGVVSLGVKNAIVEQVGTSFAAPLVSSLVANVHGAVRQPMSTALARALVIHSAVLARQGIDAQGLRYRGFGVPGDAMEILFCTPWAATLIFDVELEQGMEFHKSPFPIPQCLRTPEGAVRGDFSMTLVYDPPLDFQSGAEYCRTNVDASFGTYDPDASGKRQHRGQLPPQPRDVSKLQEKHLIEHGFKWSPVKVYQRSIPRGIAGQTWRLTLSRSSRANLIHTGPQAAAVVLTMADPAQEAPVYDEMVRAMASAGWMTSDLQVKAKSRYRIR